MAKISATSRSFTLLTVMGLGFLASLSVVQAAISPAPIGLGSSQSNPQVTKLIADATQALKNGNLSLATIQLKNAVRLDPDNGTALRLLGVALLEGNNPVAAEHNLREGRSHGAKDADVVPPLLQSMEINKKWNDILGQFPDPASGDKSRLAASILNARALAYQSTGNKSDAISSIDRSLKIQRDVSGLLRRVQIAMLQSDFSGAMTYVNQALALDANNPNALLTKAQILSISDKTSALALIDSILKVHPNALNAVVARIELLMELSRNDEAQQAVDAVLSKNPDAAFATFYNALLLGIHNKPLDGWRIAQSLSSEFIQSQARYAIGTAQLAAGSGNLEIANAILTTFVSQHQAVVEARLQLAALHIKMNNLTGALNDLGPLMNSQDPRVLEFIASTYARFQRQGDVITYLRKADAAGSKSGLVKYQLALADLGQGNTSQGMQEMLDGMKIQPGNLNAPEEGIFLLLRQSKFVEAQTIADQAEKSNPKSPVPPFFKGEILFAQRKKDEGAAAINQSLQRDPHYMPALDARAQNFIAQNRYPDAEKVWNQVQAEQPNNPVPYVKLAQIAALSKQSNQSLALLNKAVAKDPKRIGTRFILARYQVDLKQYAQAEATLKSALQISPNDRQTLALYGQVQQLLGQTAAAVNTNKTLVQKDQQSGAAQALLANSLLASGDKKGAIAAFKRAIELSPSVIQYSTWLIDTQIQSGDIEGAVATARVWANAHKNPDGAILLAATLARIKRFDEATSVIATSQKSKPDWRFALLDSQIASTRGNGAHALSILKNWLIDHSSDIPVREAYASALMHANDNTSALVQYEIVLKIRDDIPTVLNNTAWLVKDTDPSRALTLASKAMQLQPNSPDINDTLGLLLLKKGDAKGALPVLQRAHVVGPTSGEISYHLALALNSLGRKADAKQVIQTALAKDDKFLDAPDAKKLLQKL